MRKQTKLVAVLSAAALLAMGASMTSFAAGWEKDDAGIWHYYDRDDEMVESEWRKDGGKWFYLDDDGEMLTDSWVEDEYYVGSDGAMLMNQWIKTSADDDVEDPEDDGDAWYYFGSKGKKTTDDSKKINGRTYYFDTDGKMRDGWFDDEGSIYYLGGEDEGWRIDSQWLWLEKPDEDDEIGGCNDDDTDPCDEEGWYYFGSNGKMYQAEKKKKVNGKYYYFNAHGQMLYEWINNNKVSVGSGADLNASLDGSNPGASPSDMLYLNQVEEGWRADGWYEIDGSEDTNTDNDTDWYYFDKGEAKKADRTNEYYLGVDGDGDPVYRKKIKIKASSNKYFCFDEYGRMQTGLQVIKNDGFYYFDDNGYMKTGKISNVKDDDDSWTFYFNTKNGGNGKGWTGDKSGYLYWNGKRLEADDDYRIYVFEGKWYLVNSSGKIQTSESKKYDIEGNASDLYVTFNNDDTIKLIYTSKSHTNDNIYLGPDGDGYYGVTYPSIALYDTNWVPSDYPDEEEEASRAKLGDEREISSKTSGNKAKLSE